jgi:hypothetical protein
MSTKSRDAIKELLKRHPHGRLPRGEIIKALRADGVDTVPKLVDLLLTVNDRRSLQPVAGPVLAGAALAIKEAAPTELEKIVHRPPRVPLYVDGVNLKPSEISQFDGRPLHFVVTKPDLKGEIVLQAFTGMDYLNHLKATYVDRLNSRVRLDPTDWFRLLNLIPLMLLIDLKRGDGGIDLVDAGIGAGSGDVGLGNNPIGWGGPPGPPSGGVIPTPGPWGSATFSTPFTIGQVQMFSNIHYEDDWFWLPSGYMWPDLRQVPRDVSNDWNGAISSMTGTGSTVTYFDHINPDRQQPITSANSLTIGPNTPVPDLGELGWNDKISSVVNWLP